MQLFILYPMFLHAAAIVSALYVSHPSTQPESVPRHSAEKDDVAFALSSTDEFVNARRAAGEDLASALSSTDGFVNARRAAGEDLASALSSTDGFVNARHAAGEDDKLLADSYRLRRGKLKTTLVDAMKLLTS
ncbi:hypothetical protein B0H13DRAFT_1863452 [Mycena leptocephala]|nr:hypothetical protein B0H13DRAFT_1863452 [Mycena leptocephala]